MENVANTALKSGRKYLINDILAVEHNNNDTFIKELEDVRVSTEWVLPLSPLKFDLMDYFKVHDTFVWKSKRDFQPGDTVYIYLTKPIKEVRFKCTCVQDKVDQKTLNDNQYAIQGEELKYAQFKKVAVYSEGQLKWEELHAHGLGQALMPMKVYPELKEYFKTRGA